MLWAAFVDTHYIQGFISLGKFQLVGPYTPEDVFSKRMDKNQNYFSRSLGIGEKIVDRMKLLNIVEAENIHGLREQLIRHHQEGAPMPTADISTEVDTFDEVREIWKWARHYPKTVEDAMKSAAPEGIRRRLAPIPTYAN